MIINNAFWRDGIFCWDASDIAIFNCTINDNDGEGIFCWYSPNVTVFGCTIENNNFHGVHCWYASNITISGCEINNNGFYGVYCSDSSNVTIFGCGIGNNGLYGIYCNALNVTVHYCNITSNAEHGIYNWGNYVVNATYCWWGSPNGPEYKEQGDPDDPEEVYGNVVYNPWLTQPILSPRVKIIQPAAGVTLESDSVTVAWNVTEGSFPLVEVEIRLDNGPWIDVTGRTSYTFTGLSEGSHTVAVKAIDEKGLVGQDYVPFYVKFVPPTVRITEPSSGEVVESDIVAVSWEVTKGSFNVVKVEIRLDEGEWIDVTGRTSYTFTGLSEGSHTVVVRAIDEKGLTGEDSVSFSVEFVPPSVRILQPSNGTVVENDTVTVVWDLKEGSFAVAKVEIRLDAGDWIDVTGRNDYTFTGLSEGSHTVVVRAVDEKGLVGQDAVRFAVRLPAPGPAAGPPGLAVPPIPAYVSYVVGGILAIAVAVVVVLLRKRRRGEGPTGPR